jgi:AraC-like DNA-binding protein
MSWLNDMRREAIRDLPAFPRTLFLLHNFYDVDVDVMAQSLVVDRGEILACLSETRSLIHRYRPYARPERFDPTNAGLPIARLERPLREEYRAGLEAVFAGCGYRGEYRRLRRPSPQELDPPQEQWSWPHWPNDEERQQRFDSLPDLTQGAYVLFHLYGRNSHEIAQRLGISRRSVQRRIRRATYCMAGWSLPSLSLTLRFELDRRWEHMKRQSRGVRAALRD